MNLRKNVVRLVRGFYRTDVVVVERKTNPFVVKVPTSSLNGRKLSQLRSAKVQEQHYGDKISIFKVNFDRDKIGVDLKRLGLE